MTPYPTCECILTKLRTEDEAREEVARKALYARRLAHSGLGSRYEVCSLTNFERRPGTESMLAATTSYIGKLGHNLAQGKGLLLYGPPGTGKSHLAAAIALAALGKGYDAAFERVPQLLVKIRATYSSQSNQPSEGDITRRLTSADLLVLDDAGAEKWTEWVQALLYTVIDTRYSYKGATLITTNTDLDALGKKLGPRTLDRLLEMCSLVETTASSYRQERALGRAP